MTKRESTWGWTQQIEGQSCENCMEMGPEHGCTLPKETLTTRLSVLWDNKISYYLSLSQASLCSWKYFKYTYIKNSRRFSLTLCFKISIMWPALNPQTNSRIIFNNLINEYVTWSHWIPSFITNFLFTWQLSTHTTINFYWEAQSKKGFLTPFSSFV